MGHVVGHTIVSSVGTVSTNSNIVSIEPEGIIDCTIYAGYVIRINVRDGGANFYLTNYKEGAVLNIVTSDVIGSPTNANTLHAPPGGAIDGTQSINLNTIVQYAFQIFIYDSSTAYSTGFAPS